MYMHRGLYKDYREENTIKAFSEAVRKGYGFECDVRISFV